MNKKDERLTDPHLFYALVDLKPQHAVTYIVPSSVLAHVLWASHDAWLKQPGREGQPHNDNDVRRIRPKYPYLVPDVPDGWLDQYRDGWHIISQ
jgi:hypothetical protein